MSISKEERAELVNALARAFNAGQAEQSDPHELFPVAEHVRALEPEVALVVGDRGAGKTQLVRAFESRDVREALVRHNSRLRLPAGNVEWRVAWPLGTSGPDAPAWRRFAAGHSSQREDVVALWLAYLLRCLGDKINPGSRVQLSGLIDAAGADPDACFAAYQRNATAVTAALDELDGRLAQGRAWIMIAYDELDTLVLDDWPALGTLVRGLVSFWAAYARRWQRLRPKIFLRTDFYRHHGEIAGADVAKLAANRVDLQWSDRNAYGALIKHILNKRDAAGDDRLFRYFKPAVDIETDRVLGHVPKLVKAEDARPFVERLISEYMGANRKKGLAFKWVLDHLRDGNGKLLPRTLIWLIELAAEFESQHPAASGSHLLNHVSVRNALDLASKRHVDQAESNEFRWLAGLRERLKPQKKVPWDRRQLIKLLADRFDATWGRPGSDIRPPGEGAEEVVENLMVLGVIRERPDGSVDVPDLYLAGLDLKRRGGVERGE